MLLIYISLFSNVLEANENIKYFWDETPTIKICEDSNLEIETVRENFEFMAYEYNIPKFQKKLEIQKTECPDEIDHEYDNLIFIKNFKVNEYKYANTITNWTMKNKEKHVNNAIIYFPNVIEDSIKEIILRHEIGHAIGYKHIENDPIMKSTPISNQAQ